MSFVQYNSSIRSSVRSTENVLLELRIMASKRCSDSSTILSASIVAFFFPAMTTSIYFVFGYHILNFNVVFFPDYLIYIIIDVSVRFPCLSAPYKRPSASILINTYSSDHSPLLPLCFPIFSSPMMPADIYRQGQL